jgi:hypothetical protein
MATGSWPGSAAGLDVPVEEVGTGAWCMRTKGWCLGDGVDCNCSSRYSRRIVINTRRSTSIVVAARMDCMFLESNF